MALLQKTVEAKEMIALQNQVMFLTKSKVMAFIQNNQLEYIESLYTLNGTNIQQVEVATKKLFKKVYNFFFIESDNFDEIESVARALAGDKSIIKNTIVVFCETELNLSDDYCCYMGTNGQQFVSFVYHNKVTDKYCFYTDIDTPKLVKQMLQYILK